MPVVFINGARQVGKTTLVKKVFGETHEYYTLDDSNILGLLAGRVGSLLNNSDLSRSLQIPNTTLKRYLNLLKMSYLFCPLKPWFENFGKKLTKSEKVYLNDTALLEYVLHQDTEKDTRLFGHVLENFVAMELIKQISYKSTNFKLYHYRTINGDEVDFILEAPNGQIIGIEIKNAANFSFKDSKALCQLKASAKHRFAIGVVFYQGSQLLPLENKIYAVLIQYLWN